MPPRAIRIPEPEGGARDTNTNPYRTAREQAGLSAKQLAHAMQVDPSYVSGVERGTKKPSAAFTRKFIAALEIDDDEFLESPGREMPADDLSFSSRLFRSIVQTETLDPNEPVHEPSRPPKPLPNGLEQFTNEKDLAGCLEIMA